MDGALCHVFSVVAELFLDNGGALSCWEWSLLSYSGLIFQTHCL